MSRKSPCLTPASECRRGGFFCRRSVCAILQGAGDRRDAKQTGRHKHGIGHCVDDKGSAENAAIAGERAGSGHVNGLDQLIDASGKAKHVGKPDQISGVTLRILSNMSRTHSVIARSGRMLSRAHTQDNPAASQRKTCAKPGFPQLRPQETALQAGRYKARSSQYLVRICAKTASTCKDTEDLAVIPEQITR